MYVHTYCVLTMKILHARLVFAFICMYVYMYVCIYIERESVCKKQVDCLWKQICVYAICMYYVWIVCDRVCMYPAFFFWNDTNTHNAHTFDTCSRRVFASVAAGAGSGARLRCQTRELPSVAAGALSRACDICTHVITHNSLQVSTSLYIKMTLLRALVIKIIGMYVCMYVGTYIYITPQVSPPIIFAMEKRWEK